MTESAASTTLLTAERAAVSTVLVVDDLADNRVLLRRHLAKQGYAVTEADDAQSALAAIRAAPPDLVLLDVQMPGIDGYECCRRLKDDRSTSLLPVIIVTSLESREDRIRSIECGADEFLTKPVNKEELLARVRSLLKLQEARRELEALQLAVEQKKQAQIRTIFSRYLNPAALDKILDQPESEAGLLQVRDRQDAVALFADLRGFTAMSEALAPPKVVAVLNRYFTLLIGAAHQHQGTTFSMAGDSLLVGFGVPRLGRIDPARQALEAAAQMQRGFFKLAAGWKAKLGVDVGLGIGINRGEVIVGNIGSAMFLNYTMIGDAVNVAARIESQARPGEILCTEAVRAAVPSAVFTPLEPMQLKGKAARVPVYRLEYAP